MFSLITKQISKAPLSTSFLSPRCSAVPIASSRLSDSEGGGKIGPSEEKKRGKGGGEGGRGGGTEEEPVSLFLMDRFWYTSSWYTLWSVNFVSFCQHPQSAWYASFMTISIIPKTLHVRDFEESKLCRILQECLQHFSQLTSPITCFERLSYYTFKVFWRI